MKTNCRSKCKSRIYNVDIIVVGESRDVRRFLRDNAFINDLYGLKLHDYNPPVVPTSRARASCVCGGMQSAAKPLNRALQMTE